MVILSPDVVPPGGWVFKDPNTEFVIKHHNIEALFRMALQHRAANSMELSNELFIETVCQSTRNAACSDGTPPNLLVQAGNFVKEMAVWAASGFGNASDEVLAERRQTCESCEHWGGIRGGSLLKGRCRLCGCTGIKLALATSKCPASKWKR